MNTRDLKKIPLFPINMVVLPEENVPLHIFESRYKKMINNCLVKNSKFGIVYIKNDKIENIGCSISILEVLKKYDTGKYDLICKGEKRFKIIKLTKVNDLWYGDVEFLKEDYDNVQKKYFNKTLDKYLKILIAINPNVNFQKEIYKKKSFDFTKNVVLPKDIKQIFLNLKNEKSRLDFINDFLDSLSLTEKEVKNKKTILN